MVSVRKRANLFAYRLLRYSNSFHKKVEDLIIRTEDIEIAERRARSSKWYRDNGDKTLRINYPLSAKSIVFDVGGYHGDWAQDIYCYYGSVIHIFEPVKEFMDIIKQKFNSNPAIRINQFGLSGHTASEKIFLAEGSTSMIKESGESKTVRLVKASEYINQNKISHIDLLKINIEGGEYELLEHLIKIGFIKNITDIQVQFHNFTPDAESRMKAIQKELSKTHKLTYHYPWVWDNWTLKAKSR